MLNLSSEQDLKNRIHLVLIGFALPGGFLPGRKAKAEPASHRISHKHRCRSVGMDLASMDRQFL